MVKVKNVEGVSQEEIQDIESAFTQYYERLYY